MHLTPIDDSRRARRCTTDRRFCLVSGFDSLSRATCEPMSDEQEAHFAARRCFVKQRPKKFFSAEANLRVNVDGSRDRCLTSVTGLRSHRQFPVNLLSSLPCNPPFANAKKVRLVPSEDDCAMDAGTKNNFQSAALRGEPDRF